MVPNPIAKIVAVCVSSGGVPKWPLAVANVAKEGVEGDGHAHAKHNRPDRAISIFDMEIMRDLVREGFPLEPGTAGENLTVEQLHVQQMEAGTLLEIGDVVLQLETPRKPCFVLDVIDPRLKDAIAGRCGYMASVIRGGTIRPGMAIRSINAANVCAQASRPRLPCS
jgi:MOSC domain-containing protein YiiM